MFIGDGNATFVKTISGHHTYIDGDIGVAQPLSEVESHTLDERVHPGSFDVASIEQVQMCRSHRMMVQRSRINCYHSPKCKYESTDISLTTPLSANLHPFN